MGFQLRQVVPCVIFLSILCISQGKEENPCKCSNSEQDRRSNHSVDNAGYAFRVIDKRSGVVWRPGVNFVSNISDADQLNRTGVLSTINRLIQLWQDRPDGLGVDEASFSVSIVYQPMPEVHSGLTFVIIPMEVLETLDQANSSSLAEQLLAGDDVHPLHLSDSITRSASVPGTNVSVTIGTLVVKPPVLPGYDRVVGVEFLTDPPAPGTDAAGAAYKVWVDYDRVRLSVFVEMEGKPKPVNAIAYQLLNISSVVSQYLYFSLVSTAAQLLRTGRGIEFRVTVEDLPRYYALPADKGGFMSRKVTILSSVLGSVAATAVVATAVAFYFNSRYRRWHRDLDQLAHSMERLPGVPTKVDFADINKATGNFHETMKLGGGGFGTVYRCTLPAAASKTEQPMDVAIKRFTRDVRNHRFDDFLAEVSIINRLRHKNIVPLIGWSYNKGEPLLVFEFMTNGSLDQHLFPKGGNCSSKGGQPRTGVAIRQWATRYEIVRDIATGLHYVHHEYEPMVLHRDIKASNIMLDWSLCARLGDFGLACTVAVDRNSVTGVAGTWGYIAPEYAVCGKATRQTDIYALGVLILEVVTGQRALANEVVDDDDVHITDRVWRYHTEGRLLECLDPVLITAYSPNGEEHMHAGGDAERLLLLGLACSNPNPSDRPTMPDVVRVIAKLAPPPEVPPQRPRFVWPPPEERRSVISHDDSVGTSVTGYLESTNTSTCDVQEDVILGHPAGTSQARSRSSWLMSTRTLHIHQNA